MSASVQKQTTTVAPVATGISVSMVALGVFVVCALGAAAAFGLAALDGEQRRDTRLVEILRPEYVGDNRLAPDFTLRDRAGKAIHLRDLRGKTVVLHFWSSDCPPCVRELSESLPAFDEIARSRSDIALVLVTVDRDWNAISALVPNGFRAPILFDPDRRVVDGRYGTRLFPETWVIDPRGVIRARFDHTLEWEAPAFAEYVTSFR